MFKEVENEKEFTVELLLCGITVLILAAIIASIETKADKKAEYITEKAIEIGYCSSETKCVVLPPIYRCECIHNERKVTFNCNKKGCYEIE